MMKTPRIALLPGDGIGPEVLGAAKRVLDSLGFEAEYISADIGWSYWKTEGDALPKRTIETLESCDAALFGAITSKPPIEAENELAHHLKDTGLSYTSPIVRLRQHFNLYIAMRPCQSIPGNPLNIRDDIDIVVFRENTEGLYVGIEWHPVPEALAHQMANPTTGHPDRMQRWFDAGLDTVALSTRFVSKAGCQRITRAAFEYAKTHKYPSVTLFEKPNILRKTGGLMTSAFRDIAKEFPGIDALEANIDAACMQLVREPNRFGVVVAENMFGDIVSDLAAGLVGGLGFSPSANIGDSFALFEPTHGSAPDITGRGTANPTAMILSAGLLLSHIGRTDLAKLLHSAVNHAFKIGRIDTPDVAGPEAPGTTESVTNAIIDALTNLKAATQ